VIHNGRVSVGKGLFSIRDRDSRLPDETASQKCSIKRKSMGKRTVVTEELAKNDVRVYGTALFGAHFQLALRDVPRPSQADFLGGAMNSLLPPT